VTARASPSGSASTRTRSTWPTPPPRAWLEVFIWPEHPADLATLRAAAELYATVPGPAVVRGDATTDTARLLGDLPGDEPVVVFTASLLSYLEPAARAAFADQLGQAARRRRLAWVFAELLACSPPRASPPPPCPARWPPATSST
jgi:hypothetical protein